MHDKSCRALMLANAITILMALIFNLSVYDVMLVYWFQSISIGIFTFSRLLHYPLEKYQREIDDGNAQQINDREVSDPKAAKIFIAGFFALHYGFFHLVYIIFIVGFAGSEGYDLNLLWGLIGALLFSGNHYYSYRVHAYGDGAEEEGNRFQPPDNDGIGDIFNTPYARIIPIHLTIMAGAAVSHFLTGGRFENRLVLLIFMGLKTFMDVKAHQKKHETKVPD